MNPEHIYGAALSPNFDELVKQSNIKRRRIGYTEISQDDIKNIINNGTYRNPVSNKKIYCDLCFDEINVSIGYEERDLCLKCVYENL